MGTMTMPVPSPFLIGSNHGNNANLEVNVVAASIRSDNPPLLQPLDEEVRDLLRKSPCLMQYEDPLAKNGWGSLQALKSAIKHPEFLENTIKIDGHRCLLLGLVKEHIDNKETDEADQANDD